MTSLPLLLILALMTLVSIAAALPLRLLSSTWPDKITAVKQVQDASSTDEAILDTLHSISSQLSAKWLDLDQIPGRWRSTGLSLFFPDSEPDSKRQRRLVSIRNQISAQTLSSAVPQSYNRFRKRAESSLCSTLGLQASGGCSEESDILDTPEQRSSERKEWPSMYLLGGAIGR